MFHHDLRNTGYSPSTAPRTNNVLWTYPTGGLICSSPAVVDGRLFISSMDGKLYALNATSGVHLWNYTMGPSISPREVHSSPAVANGVVYVGYGWGHWTENGMLYAVNASTGELIWSYNTTETMVNTSPAVAEGLVFFGTYNWGRIFALNASTGDHVWNITTSSSHVSSSPAVVNGVLYMGVWWENAIYAYNASTGDVMTGWPYITGYVVGGGPAVFDGVVYAHSQDRNLFALNASTGAYIWKYTGDPTSEKRSSAVAYDMVFVGGDQSYALNKTDGALVWNKTGDYNDAIAVADGMVFLGASTRFYALNAFNGEEVWSYPIGINRDAHPAVAYGKVFVGSRDGKIYCFGAGPPIRELAKETISNDIQSADLNGDGNPDFRWISGYDISFVSQTLHIEINIQLAGDDPGDA